MNGSASPPPAPGEIETRFEQLLQAWNHQGADGFAALFSESATVVGFDGSVMPLILGRGCPPLNPSRYPPVFFSSAVSHSRPCPSPLSDYKGEG
jgi:hypothetical protein